MTFFQSRKSIAETSIVGILTPVFVGLMLMFSATVLVSTTAHGQADNQSPQLSPPATEADWIKGIATAASAIAGPGFAVWYAYHMTTKRIPEVEKGHKETIDRMQSDHTAEVKGLIENFRADIKQFWETKRQDDNMLREVLKQMGAK